MKGKSQIDKDSVQLPGTLMEHSKIIGSKEEYGSSVSGWTMYIGSPVHENYNNDDDDDDHNTDEQADKCNEYYNCYNDDDGSGKSDDSMASDASSGPSHRELAWKSNAQGLDRHGASKYSSKEKLHKQKMKRNERRSKPVLTAKGTVNQAQTGAKTEAHLRNYILLKDDQRNARRVLGVHAIMSPCLNLRDRIECPKVDKIQTRETGDLNLIFQDSSTAQIMHTFELGRLA